MMMAGPGERKRRAFSAAMSKEQKNPDAPMLATMSGVKSVTRDTTGSQEYEAIDGSTAALLVFNNRSCYFRGEDLGQYLPRPALTAGVSRQCARR